MVNLPFRDRAEAGRLLGAELASRKFPANTMVLALLRGGVAVGVKVAETLGAPLDVVVVRKLGVPSRPELAMGAVAGQARVLDQHLIRALRIRQEDVEAVVVRETREMERRERLYRGGSLGPNLQGRSVVLVDDGLATGSSMVAAVRHVRAAQPQKVTVAVPVASSQACDWLSSEADECICLAMPESFHAVGEWYVDFRQVTDTEVLDLLGHSRRAIPTTL
jgi:putative phosphoribosyl transferase